MTSSELVLDRPAVRRNRVLGGVYILIGLAILVLFVRTSEPGQTASFGLHPARTTQAIPVPNIILPVLPSLYVMAGLTVFLGFYQLARAGTHSRGLVVGLVSFFLVISFLTWAARGTGFNLVGILEAALQRSTPIALAALSGILCERSGIINIAIEGMMLSAACCSAIAASVSGNLWVGVIASLLLSALLGALLAVLSIRYKVNQIISGTAINILATGITSYIAARYLASSPELNSPGRFANAPIPLLARIPVLGPMAFENNLIVYMMLALLILVHVMLFYTPWGLRTRAVGEHPRAADTLGIDVLKMRYINVMLGGAVAGLGGVFLVLGSVPRFDQLMTAGKGFIGLAAMIFGNWNPFGAFGASLIFGFTDSLQAKLQILNVPIPWQFLRMAPYLITMIILAGAVGRAEPPAAEGQPYEKQ